VGSACFSKGLDCSCSNSCAAAGDDYCLASKGELWTCWTDGLIGGVVPCLGWGRSGGHWNDCWLEYCGVMWGWMEIGTTAVLSSDLSYFIFLIDLSGECHESVLPGTIRVEVGVDDQERSVIIKYSPKLLLPQLKPSASLKEASISFAGQSLSSIWLTCYCGSFKLTCTSSRP